MTHLGLRRQAKRERIPQRSTWWHHVRLEILILRHQLARVVDLLVNVMELPLRLPLRRLPRTGLASVLVLLRLHAHLLFVVVLIHRFHVILVLLFVVWRLQDRLVNEIDAL